MKRFTIPTQFGNTKSPFHVYIGEPDDRDHPLRYQMAWLKEYRGGEVPEEVVESFRKLHEIAITQKTSFEELTVYALGEAGKQNEAKAAGKSPTVPAPPPKTNPFNLPPLPPKSNPRLEELKQVNEALQAAPDDPNLLLKRAEINVALVKHQDAIADFDRVLALDNLKDINPVTIYTKRAKSKSALTKYDDAIADYREAIQLEPDNLQHAVGIAQVHKARRSYTDALLAYHEIILKDGRNPQHYLDRADIYLLLKNSEAAIAECTMAISLDVKVISAYEKRATAYTNLNKHAEAIQDISQALVLNPNNMALVKRRIQAYIKAKMYDKAKADCTLVIEHEQNAIAYYERAKVHQLLADLDAAQEDLAQAISKNARYSEAYELRAQIYEKQGNLQLAIENLSKALDYTTVPLTSTRIFNQRLELRKRLGDSQGLITDYLNRALKAEKNSNLTGALTDYNQILALDSNHVQARTNRLEIYVKQGKFELALQDSEYLVDQNTVNVTVKTHYAKLLWITGDYAKAVKICNDLLATPQITTKYELLCYRGLAKLAQSETDAAISDFNAAISFAPQAANAYVYRAKAHRAKVNLNAALIDLDKSINLNPSLAMFYLYRAELHRALGNDAKAEADTHAALTIQPNLAFLE